MSGARHASVAGAVQGLVAGALIALGCPILVVWITAILAGLVALWCQWWLDARNDGVE